MSSLTVVDVAARDGLQNEAAQVSTADKLELLRRLEAAGIRAYEATSFVHPKLVPQMADAEAVYAGLPAASGITRVALVVNGRGLERARAAGVMHVRLVVAATETMNQRNAHASPQETMAQYAALVRQARDEGISVAGVVAVAFGCPFEGVVDPGKPLALAEQFAELGAGEIGFADTVGMAVPPQITHMLRRARERLPDHPLALHLHNTRNIGLANAYAGVEEGVDVLDASLGGAGGCPFAPRATGNIPTEDLVFMLHAMGIDTGINLERLIDAAHWFEGVLARQLPGMVMKAGACWPAPPPLA